MSSAAPLVTVGIPTYNRPEGLERTLACITNQTYSNLEIIVSDNCSTNPDVLHVLQKYAELDKRVTCHIQKKNLSIVPNFQFLLDNASGKYFMWAADDDQWNNDFIERCVLAMETNDEVVISITTMDVFDKNNVFVPGKLNRGFLQPNLFARSFNFIKSSMHNKFFLCGLYRTAMVKNVPFHNSWGGEHLFLYEIITRGKFLLVEGPPAFHYFEGGSSKTNASIRKAFNIRSRYYFLDSYVFKYLTYQFGFKNLSFLKKAGLFFTNGTALIFNEDHILYYILIKKPVRALLNKFKNKPVEYRP
ncbi:MAG: glycosyltransferase family 2 protein [Chitinophagaceae bacterium]|nr:glycosyltransferase family 2 protein [Chitinophagaceae bacterium]